MLSLLVTVGLLVLALVFSFAKVSSRAEKITESHSAELLARKNQKEKKENELDKKKPKV